MTTIKRFANVCMISEFINILRLLSFMKPY